MNELYCMKVKCHISKDKGNGGNVQSEVGNTFLKLICCNSGNNRCNHKEKSRFVNLKIRERSKENNNWSKFKKGREDDMLNCFFG